MHLNYTAFQLGTLRQFEQWSNAQWRDATDDLVVFVRDDYAVVADPFTEDAAPVFAATDAAWLQFCRDTLGIMIPDEGLGS